MAPREAGSDGAATAVYSQIEHTPLDVAELLEKIILALPKRSVLRVQRVSKLFKQTIETSSRLQRKLFLTEDPNVKEAMWAMSEDKTICSDLEAGAEHLSKIVFTDERYIINPLLLRSIPVSMLENVRRLKPFPPRPLPNAAEFRLRLWQRYPDVTQIPTTASCMSMFITKPPIKKIRVSVHPLHRFAPEARTISNPAGVKFEDVVREIEDIREAKQTDSRCLRDYVVKFEYGLFIVGESEVWGDWEDADAENEDLTVE